MSRLDGRPVRRVERHPDAPVDPRAWPATVPAVGQLLREGLDLPAGVTFLVGENGSGKSTLVEGIAAAYGLNPEGGSPGARHVTRPSESPLGDLLRVSRGASASRWGFFLRAETMHGFFTYLEDHPSRRDPVFHEMSHGESFLALLATTRYRDRGFFCFDEPEAALSLTGTLALTRTFADLAAEGAQVLCATHSPVLTALPGAHVLEVGEWGLRATPWAELDLVRHWRAFLDAPADYLRHVLAP